MIDFKTLAPDLTLSQYQKNFLTEVSTTNNNILVSATAGSGKTSTALLTLKVIPKFRRTVFLSFSNTIVNELKARVPSHIKATTLHSLGMNFISTYYPGIKVNPNKYLQLALEYYHSKNKEIFKKAFQVQDISAYIRMTLTPFDQEKIIQMCDKFDLDFSDETIDLAIQLIRQDDYPRSIDFADMIFMPATNVNIIQESFHNIICDEAQDLNASQIQFINNIVKENGRVIYIGDPYQSIYGFAGSDVNCFKSLKSTPNISELPLSISYRCAKNIVEEAQKLCPSIEAAPKAKKGVVRFGDWNEIDEGDMVVCRNNAPLVDLYFRLIEDGTKAMIIGKEIEKGIERLAEQCMAPIKDRFFENMLDKLDQLTNDLVQRGVSSPQKHIRYQNLADKIDLLEIINNKVNSTVEIIPTLKGIFSEDKKEGVKLMTIHKAKGLESDRVFFMKNYKGKQLIPSQFAVQKWQLEQETNLEFVAITRAKNELVYFDLQQ